MYGVLRVNLARAAIPLRLQRGAVGEVDHAPANSLWLLMSCVDSVLLCPPSLPIICFFFSPLSPPLPAPAFRAPRLAGGSQVQAGDGTAEWMRIRAREGSACLPRLPGARLPPPPSA